MHEVEVSYVVEPSYEEIVERLTPLRILEYADVYEIRDHEPTADGAEVVVSLEDAEMTVAFSELEDGYEYRFVDGAEMFEERYSRITVEEGNETRISAVSRYSFDSIWSFVLDRLGAGTVRQELELVITNLLEDLDRSDSTGARPRE
jgi:hypothetical protein